MKRENKYHEVVELQTKLDKACGGFLFSEIPFKDVPWKKFKGSRLFINHLLILIMVVCNMIIQNFSLLSVIIGVSLYISCATDQLTVYNIISRKSENMLILEFCMDLYDLDITGRHKFIREAAEKWINKVHWLTKNFIKFTTILVIIDGFLISLIFGLVGCFLLPDSVYPKYSNPLPFQLPFLSPNTLPSFIINLFYQTKCAVDLTILIAFLMATSITVHFYFLGYQLIIIDAIKLQHDEILKIFKNKEKHSIEDFIKHITDMINKLNGIINIFKSIYSSTYLLLEIACIGVVFMIGMIFAVIKQQHIFAIGHLPVVMVFYFCCWLNEKIIEKFGDISYELYNLPWYHLPIEGQKLILIAMNCNRIQTGTHAMHFNVLKVEQFSKIMKAAYSNFIILKDLV